MDRALGIRRTSWREVVKPAADVDTGGFRLVAPDGILAERVDHAFGPLGRMRGLLGRTEIREGEALVLAPCGQVHTFGMRYAIDAVFCDRELRVLATATLQPSRMSRPVRRAWCCFELPNGSAARAGALPGAQLRFERKG